LSNINKASYLNYTTAEVIAFKIQTKKQDKVDKKKAKNKKDSITAINILYYISDLKSNNNSRRNCLSSPKLLQSAINILF